MTAVTQQQVVGNMLRACIQNPVTHKDIGRAFAPSNIALVKYWGKSNIELNIPNTDSLSISLGKLGAKTTITIKEKSSGYNNNSDEIILNNTKVPGSSDFALKIYQYLDLFRIIPDFDYIYKIETEINIPVAAGVASSACGFAALLLSFCDLFQLSLDKSTLSVLARHGSGSAARSLWDGFVYWQRGKQQDGSDSYAFKIADKWPDLKLGLLILSVDKKKISSREAMQITSQTSILYQVGWHEQVTQDLVLMKHAIANQNLQLLGETAENNALAMHATMLSSKPAISYLTPETLLSMNKVWDLRANGVMIYFTQDAGPNLKLIYSQSDSDKVEKAFAGMMTKVY